jgi:hypothetical protein
LLLLFADTLPASRLKTTTASENQSNYKGGYDMRAAAFESQDQRAVVLWVINRASNPIEVNFDFKQRTAQASFQAGSSLVCAAMEGRCAGEQFRVFPVNKAQVKTLGASATVLLPAHSVSTLTFSTTP